MTGPYAACSRPFYARRPVTPLDDLRGRPAWHEAAACRGKPTDWWLPVGGRGSRPPPEALALCRSCAVRAECLAEALTDPQTMGIWGGTTEGERRRIRRRAIAPARS